MTFRADVRAAAAAFLTDYATDAGMRMQVYPARPASLFTPSGFVDRITESDAYVGIVARAAHHPRRGRHRPWDVRLQGGRGPGGRLRRWTIRLGQRASASRRERIPPSGSSRWTMSPAGRRTGSPPTSTPSPSTTPRGSHWRASQDRRSLTMRPVGRVPARSSGKPQRSTHMPVQGLVRLRKHQFGRQSVLGTKVAATRAYPFKGTPDVELNWTDPDIDTGSIDPVAAPSRMAPTLGASLTDPQLAYDNIPLLLSMFFGGGVSPTGGPAYTWSYAPASATVDDQDVATYEFGDDVDVGLVPAGRWPAGGLRAHRTRRAGADHHIDDVALRLRRPRPAPPTPPSREPSRRPVSASISHPPSSTSRTWASISPPRPRASRLGRSPTRCTPS